MLNYFTDSIIAVKTCMFLANIALIIITLNWLLSTHFYRNEGVLGWNLIGQYHRFKSIDLLDIIASFLFSEPILSITLYLRFLSLFLLLLLPYDYELNFWIIGFVFYSLVVMNYRNVAYGIDGADKLLTIIFGAFFILYLQPFYLNIQYACLWFISGNVMFAYFISAYHKVKNKENWYIQNGSLHLFNHPFWVDVKFLTIRTKHQKLFFLLDKTVLIWQLTFLIALLIGGHFLLLYLAIGVGFHLFNAFFLGLNKFLFVWLSAYPAIIFCSNHAHRVLTNIL